MQYTVANQDQLPTDANELRDVQRVAPEAFREATKNYLVGLVKRRKSVAGSDLEVETADMSKSAMRSRRKVVRQLELTASSKGIIMTQRLSQLASSTRKRQPLSNQTWGGSDSSN